MRTPRKEDEITIRLTFLGGTQLTGFLKLDRSFLNVADSEKVLEKC